MSIVKVNPGVCGLATTITVSKNDRRTINVNLDTQCGFIKKFEDELQAFNGMNECLGNFSTSKVYELAAQHCKHLACPVPSAIIKAIEVECGLALPRPVEFQIEKS